MAATFLDTFRTLSSFDPKARDLAGAPWENYVDWAIAQGLAPLAAYNLEYRLAAGDVPDWARDRLLSVYQGSLNDNVMKLVSLKRAIDEIEGMRVLLLGAPSFAESLYPHIAFRPIADIQLLVRAEDVRALVEVLRQGEFVREGISTRGAARALSDGRTEIAIFTQILGEAAQGHLSGIFERALPMKVYGPSVFRPNHEDAVLLLALEHARSGYQVPYISYVDLRELLSGAHSLVGPYSKSLDIDALKRRAQEWNIERALYTSVAIAQRLFPEIRNVTEALKPSLRSSTQKLLDRWVIDKVVQLGSMRILRGSERWRRLLTGGN